MSHATAADLFGQSVTAAEPKSVFGIIEAILATLTGGSITVTPETKQAIKDAAMAAYDAACERIDIPRIPAFIEVRLEAVGRKMLDNAIDQLFEMMA
jgi:stage V sporulation protein SpoVS